MYEASMSELYVPYMDPAESWATRVFVDAGEFYPGGIRFQHTVCPAW